VETKANLCFLKKVGGRCGLVYGTKGAVDRKSLGTAGLFDNLLSVNLYVLDFRFYNDTLFLAGTKQLVAFIVNVRGWARHVRPPQLRFASCKRIPRVRDPCSV
jgi:hypothetical protein